MSDYDYIAGLMSPDQSVRETAEEQVKALEVSCIISWCMWGCMLLPPSPRSLFAGELLCELSCNNHDSTRPITDLKLEFFLS